MSFRRSGRQRVFARNRITALRHFEKMKTPAQLKKRVERVWSVELRTPSDALTPRRWNKLTKELIDMSVSSLKTRPKTVEVGSKK